MYRETCLFHLHTIVHMSRETLSGLLYRGIFVIKAWKQGVWSIVADIFKIRVNNTNVENFGKNME